MTRLWKSFLLLLATATDRQLAKQVQYLKTENAILRSKLPQRLVVTPQERRRLVKFGAPLGPAIRQLISIVSPRTFLRWLHGAQEGKPRSKRGRPPTAQEIRELIVRIATQTGWGYTRILGELQKLGIHRVSRSTVVNILKAHGLDPGPKRGEGTWEDFIKRHAATLWACDFFATKVWTLSGLVDVFVLFFIHVGSRRVHVAGMTAHPDRPWMAQQARNMSMFFGEQAVKPTYLLRDRDGKFVREFDAVLKADGVTIVRLGPRAPNLNAVAERWVQSIKSECLNHFPFFGETHLRHCVFQYLTHYHEERPHQGVGNMLLTNAVSPESPSSTAGEVVCDERLGGLLKHYRRAA